MSGFIMAAILLGALLHATWNAFIRSASDTLWDTAIVMGGAGILAGCWLPFVALPEIASWPYLIASVLIHLGYFTFVALAYRHGELSFVYPIMRGTAPAFSAVAAAILLNESPSLMGWLGVLLISSGVIVLSLDSWRLGSLQTSSLLFALSNAGVVVMYTIVDGQGARLSGNSLSYTGWLFFLTAVIVVLAVFLFRRGMVSRLSRSSLIAAIGGGICMIGSYGIAIWAMTRAPIALVAALRETSVIFAMLIAVYFLGENISRLRLLSALMAAAGAIAIKVL